jgi:hypothetical protein
MSYYEKVPGWFDFQNLYSEVVDKSREGDILVEVGVFLGKSLSYLMEVAAGSDKNLNIYAADLFKITPDQGDGAMPWDQNAREWEKENGGEDALWNEYNKYMNEHPNKEILKQSFRENSWDSAQNFEDKSVFCCFIDASHLYENTKRDIEAWYPKIKDGGILAGHDYNRGVKRAVDEFFGAKNIYVTKDKSCWKVYL